MPQRKNRPSFEDRLNELEAIVHELEDGDIPIEKAVDRYQRGVRLHVELKSDLDAMEKKIEVLTREGQVEPFAEEGGDENEPDRGDGE